ncbi:MAG: LTA synthase family protein [Candidatus Margulisiibacteriota bacterium]
MLLKFMAFFHRFKYLLPLPFGRFSIFMGFLQVYYLYEVFATNDTGGLSFTFNSLGLVLWSVFTVMITFQILGRISKRRWVNLCLTVIGLMVYTIVAAYHFGANDLLNWAVLADNFSIAFSPEAANVLLNSLDIRSLQYGLYILILFSYFEIRYKTVSRIIPSPLFWSQRVSAIAIYLLIFILPINALDPLLNFMRTGYFYYRNQMALNIQVPPNEFPLAHDFKSSFQPKFNGDYPHIFLIIVESLNADIIHKTSADGLELTPFLNQLSKTSVTVSPFYGNSIQTAKGHFALFFSTIPALSGKTFVKHPDLKIKSIASILGEHGYQSTVFAAHKNKNFDNTGPFLTSHGYNSYETVEPYLTKADQKGRLRWGVKDELFFKRFFNYFDQQDTTHAPQFFTLLTIANHFPFDSMNANDRLIYQNPESIQDHYANSIRLVDNGIKQFYEELKKRGLYEHSLVIVTGDHAFPLGAHGNYHLEAGYHEDSFRIPFFMTWPNRLIPKAMISPASQMDIAPTILDVLSISTPLTQFQGQSLYQAKKSHPIFLIQPYAKHFSVIRYPYKYRFFSKTEQEFIYNLSEDPMENASIFGKIPPKLIQDFRKDLQTIYLTNALILNNQLLPK